MEKIYTSPSDEIMFLFNEGKNFESYNFLGAHPFYDGCSYGFSFSVWAPKARSVSLVCDKNGWSRDKNPMISLGQTGIWHCRIEGIETGEKYKFSIEAENGDIVLKADPFAFESEVRPATASITYDHDYIWQDERWMKNRLQDRIYDKPINIYELHPGSWKKHPDGSFLSYTELASELIPYVLEMGYTHIELMPVSEYPLDASWGYQIIGYYSANSRYGRPHELKSFIDACHQNDIGVIMDWVGAHFPKDQHGLARFDGSCLFEHPDSRRGEHKEWGTLVFDWSKTEVHSFLISNAVFWFKEYHIDGMRVDAVSSMLYLDYNRPDGEWLPNPYGGNEDISAVNFLQKLNTVVFERFPNIMMIAEESTAWSGVTSPADCGGLGFNFKWNMGWMHDILYFMGMDPYFRGSNHNTLTFPMMYAFSENFILPLSHDEVVHGKKSLIDKMYGSYEQKFAGLKLLYSYMYAHPGKKLLFMGGEFGQFVEWNFDRELEWFLHDYELHRGLSRFARDLNHFYKTNRSMHENDYDWNGFSWINPSDNINSVLSFMRISKSKRDKTIVVLNFAAKRHIDYEIGVYAPGDYEVVLCSDSKEYGGTSSPFKTLQAFKTNLADFKYSIKTTLPELSAVYIKKKPKRRNQTK